jgi:AcrR family transcriptional regulator/enoyl-[acyl-carrier-protein] reductase (NADH)
MKKAHITVKDKALVKKRREQIIRAAIKKFSEKGFHKTTLRELAEEAGIGAGTIYEYIRAKEEIFSLIHDFAADLVEDALDKSIQNIKDPVEKLRRMVRAEFNLMAEWADAIMLLYQESHILSPKYLQKLLNREREHLSKYEIVIEECISSSLFRNCNARVYANLIKSMIDTWVIKRWDLRGNTDRLEVERAILDLLFQGMFEQDLAMQYEGTSPALRGKMSLVIHSGSELGSAISRYLALNGAKTSEFVLGEKNADYVGKHNSIKSNTSTHYIEWGTKTSNELSDRLESEIDYLDLHIHDLGMGNTERYNANKTVDGYSEMEINLRLLQKILPIVSKKISKIGAGRIILLAPWGWDSYVDPLSYEIVKAGTAAIMQSMAKDMAPLGITVNAIVPGFINSKAAMTLQKKMREETAKSVKMGVLGEMSDVTGAVEYFSGDLAKYVTGQILEVSGGAF